MEGEDESKDQEAKSYPYDPYPRVLRYLEAGVGSSSQIVNEFHPVSIILGAMKIRVSQEGPSLI